MKVEVKKTQDSKREINIEVNGEIVKNKFEDAFKHIGESARVKGFRPGHVPRELLEKHYSADAHQLVLKELIPDLYHQAIEKEGIDAIEMPQISEVKLNRDLLSFRATVETSPVIEIKHYKGIKLNYEKVTVSQDEIKRSLDTLKESRKIDSIDGSFARGLGYPDLETLEKAIERQLVMQKENQQRQSAEEGVIEAITKDLNFKLPQSLVNRQLQDLVRQGKLDLVLKGINADKIKEEETRLSAEFEPQARRQVKVYLVLAEIAKKEKIPLDDQMPQKVIELLLKEADWKITEVKQ